MKTRILDMIKSTTQLMAPSFDEAIQPVSSQVSGLEVASKVATADKKTKVIKESLALGTTPVFGEDITDLD